VSEGSSLYFAMSTTAHIVFEQLVELGWVSGRCLDIYTSNLPLVLSAQLQRINCHIYGSYLVHEYASLTLSQDHLDKVQDIGPLFDHAFLGARGVIDYGRSLQVRTCKEEHVPILRDVVARTSGTVCVCFDSSKLECADGSSFMRLIPGVDVAMRPGAELLLVTNRADKQHPIRMRKFSEFTALLERSGFIQELPEGPVALWRRQSTTS
jgi:hypothetical protein